jgi:myosin heavy subunit
MSTETKVPHTTNGGVTATPISSETLENTVRQICIFASSSEMKIASTIMFEMQNQREQMKKKQDELSEVRKKLKEQEENQTIAMDQWFIGMQTQKSKFKAAEGQIQSLRESIAKKDNMLAESAQKIKKFGEEMKKVQSEHVNEKTKVNQLSQDITLLQKKLKESNGTIDSLQTAELGIANSLSSERKKTGELEKELTSMKSIAQESQDRLQRLEGYGFRGHQMDEDSMLAITSWKCEYMILTDYSRVDGFSSLWDYATDQLYHIMMQDIDSAVLSVSMAYDLSTTLAHTF